MGKIFFISDAHLGVESLSKETAKLEKLHKFFKIAATESDTLIILGDFFDFWFDYKTVCLTEYFEILCELRNLNSSGVEILFFGGNHDWWASEKGILGKDIGMKIYKEPTILEFYNKKFFLGHGDGIAQSDWGYRVFLRPILRNRISTFLFRLLPAEWARSIAKIVSSANKLYIKKVTPEFEKEYKDFAKNTISDGIEFVILGHIHKPQINIFSDGVYAHTGDFFEHFSYLVFDGANLELKTID